MGNIFCCDCNLDSYEDNDEEYFNELLYETHPSNVAPNYTYPSPFINNNYNSE